ncbi:ribonuclease H-like domain-containing protein [Tanacetum coccineum]
MTLLCILFFGNKTFYLFTLLVKLLGKLGDMRLIGSSHLAQSTTNGQGHNKSVSLVQNPSATTGPLFRHKYLADDTLSRYKARLVANGSTQLEGVDVDETFSLVVKLSTIRTVLSLVASRHWPIHQLDVKNAFLHTICILYYSCGFHHSHCDSSLFIYRQGMDTAYLLLYVDDIVLTASSKTLLQHIISLLHQDFSMTDLGSFNYFLGISVTRDSTGMFLSQPKYAAEILERAHMANCNPSRTPVDIESKTGDDGDPVFDPTLYRSLADHELQLFSSSTTSLVAYSDADWASCPTIRRSTLEVEYRGVANAVGETCWLRNLLRELHTPLSSATLVLPMLLVSKTFLLWSHESLMPNYSIL